MTDGGERGISGLNDVEQVGGAKLNPATRRPPRRRCKTQSSAQSPPRIGRLTNWFTNSMIRRKRRSNSWRARSEI